MSVKSIRAEARRQVTLFTLVELLIICVFISVLFAFAVSREGRELSSRLEELLAVERQRVYALEVQLEDIRDELQRVAAERDRYRRQYLQLIEGMEGTLPTSTADIAELTLVNREDYRSSREERDALSSLVDEQQRQLNRLRQDLSGRGESSTFPNCVVSSGYLLKITAHPNGHLSVEPRWPRSREDVAITVEGVREIVGSRELTIQQFRLLASRIFEWGQEQPVPCVFRVDTERLHSDADLFEDQMRAIDAYFYPNRY